MTRAKVVRARKEQVDTGEPWELLAQRLLELGGERVELDASFKQDLARLGHKSVRSHIAALREFSAEGATVVAGWPNSCEMNNIPRWLNGEGDLVSGFALRSTDQTWWCNNWLVRSDGSVLDSLPNHCAYLGEISNDPTEWSPFARELLEVYRAAQVPGVRVWPTLVPVVQLEEG